MQFSTAQEKDNPSTVQSSLEGLSLLFVQKQCKKGLKIDHIEVKDGIRFKFYNNTVALNHPIFSVLNFYRHFFAERHFTPELRNRNFNRNLLV